MAATTYFVQECPTCGRTLQVRVEYLGKRVVCQHCSAAFVACDPASSADCGEASLSMLERADRLIKSAEQSGIGLGKKGGAA